mmetsp:Transcript_105047/g.321954  ORF Transcript_105047/g.321954 Transcript_105047/m.321954 type:complete len:373 (+) Transcript_105047:658-1776(+)
MSWFPCCGLCGKVKKKSLGTAELELAASCDKEDASCAGLGGCCHVASVRSAFTSSDTTIRISCSVCSTSRRASRRATCSSSSSTDEGACCALSFGKYVCKKRVSKPSELGTMIPSEFSSTVPVASCSACVVSFRQIGHCVMRYSPGWCAIGPSTKHFQQNLWLQESSTMSEIVSRQIGHCCNSCGAGAEACPGANSESTSKCPKDSMAACNSAKSEPLKKLCRDNQPALSAAESSNPKFVCFRRFLRIFTTATAFQTAYLRIWSISRRMSTKVLKASGRCRDADTGEEAAASCESLLLLAPWNAQAPLSCSSSARASVRFSSSCCRLAKQLFTCPISATSSCSNAVFAVNASPSSCACWQSTTSLILFFKTL